MDILISVIIPAYNCEKTIKDTIESITCQTYKNYEVIVVNDGSKDGTREIVEELKKKNKKIRIYNQKNSGVSSARNKGIRESNGDYLTFLDSDDQYKDNFLEIMVSEVKESKYEIACCGYYVSKNGIEKKQRSMFYSDKILYHYILGNNQFHTSTWLISRSYIIKENILFDEEMSWGEDFKFFCKVLSRTDKVKVVKKYLSIYIDDDYINRLSSFNFNKLKDDIYLINSLKNDSVIKKDKKLLDALDNFRLPALLTYRLLFAIKIGEDLEDVKKYYYENKKYIDKFSYIYGLRSIKLAISIKKLRRYID